MNKNLKLNLMRIFTFCFSIGSMIYLILYLKSVLPYEAFVVLMGLILLEVIVLFFYFLINGLEKTMKEFLDIFEIKEKNDRHNNYN